MTIANHSLGSCQRPDIKHDNDFLEKNAPRAPVLKDHLHRTAWARLLELGEAGQGVPFMPHNDIPMRWPPSVTS